MTDKTKEAPKKDWKVVAEFWDGPHLKSVGDIVSKTVEEAKYMTPHILVPVKGEAKAPEAIKEPEALSDQKADPKPAKSKR